MGLVKLVQRIRVQATTKALGCGHLLSGRGRHAETLDQFVIIGLLRECLSGSDLAFVVEMLETDAASALVEDVSLVSASLGIEEIDLSKSLTILMGL